MEFLVLRFPVLLDLYRLGVIPFFELSHSLSSRKEKSGAMSCLKRWVLPSQLLKWPKEASFCLWWLHPEPSSRSRISELLRNGFLTESKVPLSRLWGCFKCFCTITGPKGSRVWVLEQSRCLSSHLMPCSNPRAYGKDRSSLVHQRSLISTESISKVLGSHVKEFACGGRHSAVITDAVNYPHLVGDFMDSVD